MTWLECVPLDSARLKFNSFDHCAKLNLNWQSCILVFLKQHLTWEKSSKCENVYTAETKRHPYVIPFEIENNVCQCQVHYVYENYLKTNTANKRNANTGATNQTIGRGKTHTHYIASNDWIVSIAHVHKSNGFKLSSMLKNECSNCVLKHPNLTLKFRNISLCHVHCTVYTMAANVNWCWSFIVIMVLAFK